MNRELFGVFGGDESFDELRPASTFDAVVCGDVATVGIRDSALGVPGWSTAYEGEHGACVVWGENYVPCEEWNDEIPCEVLGNEVSWEGSAGNAPGAAESNAARWLLEQYATDGVDALSALNGSYLAFLEYDGEALVATDPVRSWECFYTDEPGIRVFGTNATSIARAIDEPRVDLEALVEFLHLGVVLGEATCFERLYRLPLDSYLTPSGVERLDRFVYRPRELDPVVELAGRLRRAMDRRSRLPGRKGLLLSAGYDSRTLLAGIPDVEHCYTVGEPTAQEVRGARRLARQYGAEHTALPPDERYLLAGPEKVRYSQGIKESLHVHHAGFTDEIDVDTVYHGLFCDTLFRGYFTAWGGIDVLGKRVPLDRPDPQPDPVDALLDRFGYDQAASRALSDGLPIDVGDPDELVRGAIADALERVGDRANSVQNALHCCGIANQPSTPFHHHLADTFRSPFLAVDAELLEWHCATRPADRTTKTFLEACDRLDPDLLRHRPPDRPRATTLLNEVEGFVRRKTPLLRPFEPPWPDRRRIFETYDLDRRLVPDLEAFHDLPVRHKLRLNDVLGWTSLCTGRDARTIERLLEPATIAV